MKRQGTSPNGEGRSRLDTFGVPALNALNRVVDLVVLLLFLLVVVYGCYSVWDETRVFETGSSKVFEKYKPTSEDQLSFDELRALNPDVFAWLQVYGTPVDYPVVQGRNLHEYLNRDAAGTFTLSGSLFLDPENNRELTDSVSIIYGHHMDKQLMFGSLEDFGNKDFFEQHRYGDLFFDGQNHGLEFFAFFVADAYDNTVYDTGVVPEELPAYVQSLRERAQCTRPVDVQPGDRVVLLSTCASGTSNSRYLLAAKLTDQTFENTFGPEDSEATLSLKTRNFLSDVPVWWWVAFGLLLLVLLLLLTLRKRRNHEKHS